MRLERLIHTADLHFGEHHAGLAARLADAVERLRPQLVVVSGDLTRRARSHEFRAARRFLDGLAAPTLVVPGNHDIPLLSLRRAYAPYRKYRRHLHGDLEPEMAFDNARVRGLNHVLMLLQPQHTKHLTTALVRWYVCLEQTSRFPTLKIANLSVGHRRCVCVYA